MSQGQSVLFSFITPSRGDRPRALQRAIASVEDALASAADLLDAAQVEMLVGFDGLRGERVGHPGFVRFFDFPPDNDFGNGIRHGLLKAARGKRIVFLDDDNVLTPEAFRIYLSHPDADMLIARIDTRMAFDKPFLPEEVPGRELVRQTNIDPLCLCLSRDLVVVRCGGWQDKGYEADFLNMVRYHRRARNLVVVQDVVGVYDAGRGLDEGGRNFRQQLLA